MEKQPEIFTVPAGREPWSWKGSVFEIANHDHVHNDRGECLKNRYEVFTCNGPGSKPAAKPNFYEGYPAVEFYEEGSHITRISFKKKWQASLFHLLLNKSVFHAGSRDY